MPTRRSNLRMLLCWVVLALSTAAMVRSYFAVDKVVHTVMPRFALIPEREYFIALSEGRVFIGWNQLDPPGSYTNPARTENPVIFDPYGGLPLMLGLFADSDPPFPWFGWTWPRRLFALGAGYTNDRDSSHIAVIPLWIFAALAAAPLILRLTPHHRRRARLARGQCTRCGYDRTGLARAQRCPECNAENPPASPPR